MEPLRDLLAPYVKAVERELRRRVPPAEGPYRTLYGMVRYHLGWTDRAFRPVPARTGKRVRAALCLMAGEAVGGRRDHILPAAAAVELVHEFSLIHDDIEDGDRERRGRPTLWAVWGEAQAINAGDALFALAFLTLDALPQRGVAPERALEAHRRFTRTVVRLCEGQHLDLDFEQRSAVSPDEYLLMVEGKTAALIALAAELGALVGGGDEEVVTLFRHFGHSLGVAFQMQDDLLGLWGHPDRTGKPAGNDLRRRKKSLPILLAWQLSEEAAATLRARYAASQVTDEMVAQALHAMEEVGARAAAEAQMRETYGKALEALSRLEKRLSADRLAPLRHLAKLLIERDY